MPDESEFAGIFEALRVESYKVAAFEEYGTPGLDAVVRALDTARALLTHVPFEMLTDGIEVVVCVDPSASLTYTGGSRIQRLDSLTGPARSALKLLVIGSGRYQVWDTLDTPLSADAPLITYHFSYRNREDLIIGDRRWPINESTWPCAMAIPTFSRVEDALHNYSKQNRVPVQCAHLDEAWRDTARLAFKTKPEHLMRSSLLLALQYSLEGAQVRPELNQDESKPVDIEVIWWDTHRSAIIEIKWLGKSGPPSEREFTTTYSKGRAVEGLVQLADYLDRRDGTSSDVAVMGYLVVFDARRRRLTATATSISREDGMFHEFDEPDYPETLLNRADMGPPFRCFIEPVMS